MCTVVCRWAPGDAFPVQMLALRDELVSRAFDPPDAWWPDQPGVIGGRDRRAGGSWCVCEVATAATAVVLNRPERPLAEPGAPSRGVLPLAAVRHGRDWLDVVGVRGMASFNLVLAQPDALTWWCFDGRDLQIRELGAGTHMFTPRGLACAPLDPRLSQGSARLEDTCGAGVDTPTRQVWAPWLSAVEEAEPSADPSALLVRRPAAGDSFETVFGQLIAARAGTLRVDYLAGLDSLAARDGMSARTAWTSRVWTAAPRPSL